MSAITRIFDELIRGSRHDGQVRRATLNHGAELVTLVVQDTVTLTIKRPGKPVGAGELTTFRRDCGVPPDAVVLTPPEQGQREVAGVVWYFVVYRWQESPL